MAEMREQFSVDMASYFAGLRRADQQARVTDEKVERTRSRTALVEQRVQKAAREVAVVERAVARVEGKILKRSVKASLVGIGSHALGSAAGEKAALAYEFVESGVEGFIQGGPAVAAVRVASKAIMTLFGKWQELNQKLTSAKKELQDQIEQQRVSFERSWLQHERELRQREEDMAHLRRELDRESTEAAREMVFDIAKYNED